MQTLQNATADLLRASLGSDWQEAGPSEVARQVNVDVKLAWKLRHVATADDVLAAVRYVPGQVAAEVVADRATAAGVGVQRGQAFVRAVRTFREHARTVAGGTRQMRLLAARHASQAEPGDEAELRRNAFDAYAYATGMRMRCLWWCFAIVPGSEGGLGLTVMRGRLGLQRLRRDAVWRVFASYRYGADGPLPSDSLTRPLDRNVDPRQGPPVVADLCRPAVPEWNAIDGGGWALADGDVGDAGASDVVLGEHFADGEARRAEAPLRNTLQIAAAAESVVADVLVHRDLRGDLGSSPPTASLVMADGGEHQDDVTPVPASLAVVHSDLPTNAGFQCRHVPRAHAMVTRLVDSTGAAATDFDAFRLVLPWPLFGTILRLSWPRSP